MQSKNAMGNLKNRYIAVLKKCNLINVFGSLAVLSAISLSSGIAFAATNPEGTTITSGGMVATTEDPVLTNNGTITGVFIDSDGAKFGMYGLSTGSINYLFTNRGSISIEDISTVTSGIKATSTASGMYAFAMRGNHSFSNYGTINITARGGTATSTNAIAFANATAYGMYANANTSSNSLVNYGTITLTTSGRTATAINANATVSVGAVGMNANAINGNQSLVNYGTITVTANGGTATSNSITGHGTASTNAVGMQATTGNNSFNNYGTITVTAKGGTATGNGLFTNTCAYGMYVGGTPAAGKEHLLNNYGSINATAIANTGQASNAFEAYGYNSYSVGTFATTLRDWSATVNGNIADTVFGVNNGNTINFKNSTLILRPGTAAQGFAFGQTYSVSDMFAVIDNNTGVVQSTTTANVTGTISQAIAEVPFLTATLTNGNNPLTATVRLNLNINDETIPNKASAVQGINQVQGQMGNISSQLSQVRTNLYATNTANLTANNDDTVYINNIPKWTLFFNPYYSYTDNSKYNFYAKGMGITGGASYAMNEKLSLGGHLDFNASDYDGKDVDSYITSFALGAHANFNIMPEWYVAGQVTGVFAENDNKYSLGTSVRGDSLYDSKTFYLALNTGYMLNISAMHSLTPEIGLSYLNTHSDDYTISYNTSIYNMNYDESSYSALYADAKLNWRSEWFMQNNSTVALLAGAGLRQNLTGNEIESKFSLFGGNYKTQATEDSSTFLANIGLEYQKNGLSARLSYDGAYGSDQAKHTGNLLVKYAF